MIFADKLIKLRKSMGISQEELSDKMNVSRQAVSKWESAQSIPDLDKILKLSTLFGVSTDYLLKDDLETEEFTIDESLVKVITLEEANDYLRFTKKKAWFFGIATVFAILSPLTLIVLSILTDVSVNLIGEELAAIIGLVTLFTFVIISFTLFIVGEQDSYKYKKIINKNFNTQYGVNGIVASKKEKFRNLYNRCSLISTIFFIFSPVPLIVLSFTENIILVTCGLAFLFIIVSVGVLMLEYVQINWDGFNKIVGDE